MKAKTHGHSGFGTEKSICEPSTDTITVAGQRRFFTELSPSVNVTYQQQNCGMAKVVTFRISDYLDYHGI